MLREAMEKLPRIASLTIPTDTREAFAFIIKSWIVSGLSGKHPGGTTGRESLEENNFVSASFEPLSSVPNLGPQFT